MLIITKETGKTGGNYCSFIYLDFSVNVSPDGASCFQLTCLYTWLSLDGGGRDEHAYISKHTHRQTNIRGLDDGQHLRCVKC